MLTTLAVQGYRSLRDLAVPLGRITLITGPNGSGKSSLYRALRLLKALAEGQIARNLAMEGGMPSVTWAGPERIAAAMRSGLHPVQGTTRKKPVSVRMGFGGDDYGLAVDLGLPKLGSAFPLDPEIKTEKLWTGPRYRPSACFAERRGPHAQTRSQAGHWDTLRVDLQTHDSMLTDALDPRRAPELLSLRDHLRGWRFYDHLRTDPDAPARRPQIATQTPVLADDGCDLAPAIATIRAIGDAEGFDAAVDDALPGTQAQVAMVDGYARLEILQPGMLRPLQASELSEGTLRALMLAAALFTPRPPGLLVLNEPETSLHRDLLPALARLVARAAEDTQVIVVSHAPVLVEALEALPHCQAVHLTKDLGETVSEPDVRTHWAWPKRA